VVLGALQLELQPSQEELRLADDPEPVERTITVAELESDLIREIQLTIGVNRQNLPPLIASKLTRISNPSGCAHSYAAVQQSCRCSVLRAPQPSRHARKRHEKSWLFVVSGLRPATPDAPLHNGRRPRA